MSKEYINRELLENALEDENKNGNFVFTANWIMEIVDNLPTADVVPKSEVASMPHKCKDCAGCTQWKCDCANIELEVAREIIEIARSGAEKYINDVTLNEGIRNMLSIMLDDFIAELKKKYTGEQT